MSMNTEIEDGQQVQPASASLEPASTDDPFGPDREAPAADQDPLAGYDPEASVVAGTCDLSPEGESLRDGAVTPRALLMDGHYVHTKDGMFRREGHGEDSVLFQLA